MSSCARRNVLQKQKSCASEFPVTKVRERSKPILRKQMSIDHQSSVTMRGDISVGPSTARNSNFSGHTVWTGDGRPEASLRIFTAITKNLQSANDTNECVIFCLFFSGMNLQPLVALSFGAKTSRCPGAIASHMRQMCFTRNSMPFRQNTQNLSCRKRDSDRKFNPRGES